jgi:WD40 repeat protein
LYQNETPGIKGNMKIAEPDGYLNEKIERLKKIVESDPADWQTSLKLAVIFNNMGREDEAVIYAKKVLQYKPDNQFALTKVNADDGKLTSQQTPLTEDAIMKPEYPAVGGKRVFIIVSSVIAVLCAALIFGFFDCWKKEIPLKAYSIMQVSADGGFAPCWSSDGSKLTYVNKGTIYASDITKKDTPTVMIQFMDEAIEGVNWYDYHLNWSPDGRYLAIGDLAQTFIYDTWTQIIVFSTPEGQQKDYSGVPVFKNSWLNWFPDGKAMVYTSDEGLFLRTESDQRIQLRDSDKDRYPAPTSDGKAIILSTDVSYMGDNHYLTTDPLYGIMRLDIANNRVSNVTVLSRNKENNIKGITCSGDGLFIAYTANEGGFVNLWVMKSDGSNPTKLNRMEDGFIKSAPAWSPTEQKIAVSMEVMGKTNVWVYNLLPEGDDK